MAEKISSGEEKLWEKLLTIDPANVCKRADVLYVRDTACYQLKSFGFDFSVSLEDREIKNVTGKDEILTKRLAYFFYPRELN